MNIVILSKALSSYIERVIPKLTILVFLFFLSVNAYAQPPYFQWAGGMGGPQSDEGRAIHTDSSGYVYTTGLFSGTVDFDLVGPGVTNITSFGGNMFVQKLDLDGNLIWVKSTFGSARGASITTDALGNVYTVGSFNGTMDFDPGPGAFALSSNGITDIFIQKLDPNGNFLWAKSMGSINLDGANTVSTDSNGNVYVSGVFEETVDFDPGVGTFFLTSAASGAPANALNAFVVKLDSSGNFLWAKSIESTGSATILDITNDTNGDVYTAGYFVDSADLDPGIGNLNVTSTPGFEKMFIQRLNSNGDLVWAKTTEGTGSSLAFSILTYPNGDVLTTGEFRSVVDFDPGPGTLNQFASGGSDAFVQKLDINGNFIWVKTFGANGQATGRGMAVDGNGDIHLAGYFQNTIDFDPGVGVSNLSAAGFTDTYVQKLDVNGNFLWATSMGSFGPQGAFDLDVDLIGNVYTIGRFLDTVDFDPGPGSFDIISNGGWDIYIQKLSSNSCQPTQSMDIQSSCGSFTWIDGNTYTSSNNTATDTLVNAAGCDSVVTLNLTISNPSNSTDFITACSSYTWIDGNTYTSSNNTATVTFLNAAGCDSIVTLDLTIVNSTANIDVQSACDSYTWIDGNTYVSSNNTATYTLINSAGCDSIIILDLTINSVSNIGVTESMATLTADLSPSAGISYNWLDCDNNFAPLGISSQSFSPAVNGNYAVEITENQCTDTSACILVDNVGLDLYSSISFSITPNPVDQIVTISFDGVEAMLKVLDMNGKVMEELEVVSGEQIDMHDYVGGVYLFVLSIGEYSVIERVVKN
ncbi:MAG: T9SS type A sorting domain-containing protein [Crocinitomicaceae bacterium]